MKPFHKRRRDLHQKNTHRGALIASTHMSSCNNQLDQFMYIFYIQIYFELTYTRSFMKNMNEEKMCLLEAPGDFFISPFVFMNVFTFHSCSR